MRIPRWLLCCKEAAYEASRHHCENKAETNKGKVIHIIVSHIKTPIGALGISSYRPPGLHLIPFHNFNSGLYNNAVVPSSSLPILLDIYRWHGITPFARSHKILRHRLARTNHKTISPVQSWE